MAQRDKKIGFKTVTLFKDQILGIGAYGVVCKAKCDDLLCAAKVIHQTLFDPTALLQIAPHREHRLPIRRFQLECEFLSTVRHPNIVQYLGTHQDPDTGLPVLLMELMGSNLTHFLKSCTQPIPYHIQVNLCHDITLALSFLHSNDIVHRDLSSNNVLLVGNIRAKLTDFGMARLGDLNPHTTHFTSTMCPGTDVYMPPEAVQDASVYTEKIDCFSFGVITVQILTREFPEPGDRQMTINDARYPRGALKLCIPEIERRKNHISEVDPNHPLLPIALDCLKDEDIERPSAQQLCERLATLKGMSEYKNASKRGNHSSGQDGESEYDQIQGPQQNLKGQTDATVTKREQQLRQQHQQIQQLQRDKQQLEKEKNQAIQEKEEMERELRRLLEESEQLRADCEEEKLKLKEQLIIQVQEQDAETNSGMTKRTNIKLKWREGPKDEELPHEIERSCDAVVDNNTVYFYHLNKKLYAYHIPSSNWSQISDFPHKSGFAMSVVDGQLTTVGGCGFYDFRNTNKLFSLSGEGSERRWTEKFPPMPTKRSYVAALCTGTTLIVAGGSDDTYQILKTVEVLNIETRQWATASDLPEPLSRLSLNLCGDVVYLLGWERKDSGVANSAYSCSLPSLLSSAASSFLMNTLRRPFRGNTWNKISDLPVKLSTSVALHGQLLVIGGDISGSKCTTAVHMYQPATNSWEVISHMKTARASCLAAVLPDNQLMVVGGWTTTNQKCDSVEFGSLI